LLSESFQGVAAVSGVMPYLPAWPPIGPAWTAAPGWTPLMQQVRRTAGLF